MGKWVMSSRAVTALAALISTFGLMSGANSATAATAAAAAAANPGDIVRYEVMDYKSPLPTGAKAWRVEYLSTSGTGKQTTVSGAVIVPPGGNNAARPVVGYAPGSHGLGDQCAPSRMISEGTDQEAALISLLLYRGWAVAVTDYEGLGTPGDHAYMVGKSAGHAVLDGMRAATRLKEAGLSANAPMAVTGYSQGGAAAGWAAQLRGSYAPELPIKGIAAGGTPADLNAVAVNLDGGSEAGYLAAVAVGYDAAYAELPLAEHLTDEGKKLFTDIRDDCLGDIHAKFSGKRMNDFTTIPDLNKTPAWQKRLVENGLGTSTPQVPMRIYHGLFDSTIPLAQANTLRKKYCSAGVRVEWATYPGNHVLAAALGSIPTGNWLADRLSGRPAPSNC